MNAEDRKTILWIGDNIPNALTRELEGRGRLQIKSISEAALPADAPSARTLLLQFTGNAAQFISQVRRCRPIALGHGLGIGLVYRSESDLGEFARVTGFFDQTHRDINEKNGKAQTRIIAFIPQDWAETAEWIARYDAGPGAKENMELTGAIVAELDDEEQLLLRRSFQGLPGIHVIELAGGYSQARILTVRPHRGTGEPTRRRLAYFAKIDLLRRVIGEIDRNERFVMDLIPFDQRPNLHARLFAYGNTKAIMAGDFVDHAVPLSDLFGKFKAEGIISGSLLYGALEEWRFDAGLANLSLLNEFRRLKVLRPANELDDHGKARAQSIRSAKHHGVCMSERDFWKTVETLPPTRTRYCIIHGDLHAGNILVRVSPLNTFLIDFSKAENGPAVADPACLEVSLSFRFNEQFDPAFISKLYSYPCEVPDESIHSYEQESLLEIVQAIRRSGCWNEEGCFAYVFALVAYLFNFASYSTYPIERRRLAYYLSQRLLLDLQTSVRATK
jgi:hypothetical protein